MREHFAIDPLIGKRQQLLLATQLCRMVLKVFYFLLVISVPQLLTEYRLTTSSFPEMTSKNSRRLYTLVY